MRSRTTRARVAGAVVVASLAVVANAGGGGRAEPDEGILPGDSSVPFWPHETGALMGTSETFTDVRSDGSYYDPSVGRRVLR